MDMWLDLRQIVYVLSDALDLVGVDDVAHGKRVAYMAVRAADVMGLPPGARDDLLHAGLFHDCGVSTTSEHKNLSGGMDWGGEEDHCVRGAGLVASFKPLADLAPVIRWHHTHADVLEAMDLPVLVKILSNLVYLADRVDVLALTSGRDVLLASADIHQVIRDNLGTRFRNDVGDAFLKASEHEEFWLTRDQSALGPWLGRQASRHVTRYLSLVDLESLGDVFATIVDAKSPFTSEHSRRVAGIARVLGRSAGLSPDRTRKVGVAALLHDIGKLRIPDDVLDKPGPLDDGERAAMVRHAFDTYQILSRIDGFEDISRWAAFHHECVQGGGYPFGHSAGSLPVESRIVAVSDVLQALRQNRPYRGGMPLDMAVSLIDGMAESGRLDADVVDLMHASLEECDAAARGLDRVDG